MTPTETQECGGQAGQRTRGNPDMGMSASQDGSQEGCWAEWCVQACCADGLYRRLKAQTHTGSTPSGHTPFCVISTI